MTDRKRLDRHLDPGAAGLARPLAARPAGSPGHVQVIIGGADAATGRGQLLTWAVVNLLLRCYGVLELSHRHLPRRAPGRPRCRG